MRDLRIVTTFFKNEKYYLNTFIEWYSNHFKNNEFLFFIGDPNIKKFNINYDGLNFFEKKEIKKGITFRYLYYKSAGQIPDDWHNTKQKLWAILRKYTSDKKTLICDCDELIYTKDLDKCINEGFIKTHFYEYKPNSYLNSFILDTENVWVEQGWYYRQPTFKIEHNSCKCFYFDKRDFHHMGEANDYCKKYNYRSDWKKYPNLCFHVSVISKEQYIATKNWTHIDDKNVADINFNKTFYDTGEYETFKLNIKKLL